MREKGVVLNDSMTWVKTYSSLDMVHFSFCSLIKGEVSGRRKLEQVCNWTSCRESLVTYVRDGIAGMDLYDRNHLIDKCKMRLLVLFKKKGKDVEDLITKYIKRSIKIINFFEEKAGWHLSELFEMQPRSVPSDCYIYVLFGSRRWMKTPHMISLYTLLLRIGKFECFDEFETYDQFVAACDGLKSRVIAKDTKGLHSFPNPGTDDIRHLNYVADKIMVILKNQGKLFGKRDYKDIYIGSGFYDGITKLCTAKVEDTKLKQNFIELCESTDLDYKRKGLGEMIRGGEDGVIEVRRPPEDMDAAVEVPRDLPDNRYPRNYRISDNT